MKKVSLFLIHSFIMWMMPLWINSQIQIDDNVTNNQSINLPYIEVIGISEKEIEPDKLVINIQISENDYKGKSLQDIEKLMINKLKELNIDIQNDLKVIDLASNFQDYWFKKTEIQLTKDYQLIVHDATTAARVFLEFKKIGISNTRLSHVECSKIEKYKLEVKIEALQKAEEKARLMANAIGQKIGKAIYIKEVENYPFEAGPLQSERLLKTLTNEIFDSTIPAIEFEKIKISASVLVRYLLQ